MIPTILPYRLAAGAYLEQGGHTVMLAGQDAHGQPQPQDSVIKMESKPDELVVSGRDLRVQLLRDGVLHVEQPGEKANPVLELLIGDVSRTADEYFLAGRFNAPVHSGIGFLAGRAGEGTFDPKAPHQPVEELRIKQMSTGSLFMSIEPGHFADTYVYSNGMLAQPRVIS